MYFYVMENILRLFLDLESMTGDGSVKNKQERILQSYDGNLDYFLNVCYNPFITTKLHRINLLTEPMEGNISIEDIKNLIEILKSVPAANDSLRSNAERIINTRITNSEDDYALRNTLMKILTKRMNIGIGAKTINKALKREIIPDPSLMLATDDESEISKWSEVYCEEKYDGVRVIALIRDGNIQFYTRAFNELDPKCLSRISNEIKDIFEKSDLRGDWFFDGELTDYDRKSVSGKVNQILKGTADAGIDEGFHFHVFDLDYADTLIAGQGVIPYTIRRQTLEEVIKPHSLNHVKLATMHKISDLSEIGVIYKKIVSEGGEGVIVKKDSIYETKRSKSWIKIKEVNECDLIITGWYPGEGKREGKIGGFICSDASGTMNVKVGSGFTDKDLEELSVNPDLHSGKIASILYNVTITDKFGNRSLFLPRFVEIRNDKDTADDMSVHFS
jgi:ATP-dependent DNA ligase